jgi:drug/metabolite transporter (DMT)-like permease
VPDQHSRLQYLVVTIVIALWQGMIAVLVKWSTWPPVTMVWARCVVTIAALWLFGRWRSTRVAPQRLVEPTALTSSDWTNTRLTSWGSGALLAAHWITLFLGYRFCSVGPVVVALFTFPVMAALLEPWFFQQRPRALQLITACVAMAGVAAIRLWDDGTTAASPNTLLGIGLGLLSAAFFTARSIIARKLLRRSSALQIMHEQAVVVALLLLPSTWLLEASHWSLREVVLVVVLGVGFTAIPHTLGVWSMKKLTVATSGVIGSLQTVSTLILAQLFVGEAIALGVWLGAAAVMLAVTIEGLAHARERTS